MRKYYLFIVQPEYYKLFYKNPKTLYDLLYNLCQLKEPNLQYGFSLFNSICQPFPVKLLTHYIQNRYTCTTINSKQMKIHSIHEKTIIQIGHGCVIIQSNINFPEILKVFHIYHKKIFVCDFNNQDYFWLCSQLQKNMVNFFIH